MAWRGKFKPKNPDKYKGDATNVVFRSSLELKVMSKLDSSPNIIWWASEEIAIPYIDPTKKNSQGSYGRPRRYFPDLLYCRKNPDGTQTTVMVEIKPAKEAQPPVHKPGKKRRYIIAEEMTWATNSAKFEAAKAFCKKQGWEFAIMTEKEIGRTY